MESRQACRRLDMALLLGHKKELPGKGGESPLTVAECHNDLFAQCSPQLKMCSLRIEVMIFRICGRCFSWDFYYGKNFRRGVKSMMLFGTWGTRKEAKGVFQGK